jgi:anti-sigma factor ChrR (cupin superfamily)
MDMSDGKKSFVLDTNKMPWEERPNAKAGRSMYRKKLIEDSETGMKINVAKYPAGMMIPRHKHPCSHGMYVMEGILKTDKGEYGPGCFVWFAEGDIAEHGAVPETDVVVMFITNKTFDIEYVE